MRYPLLGQRYVVNRLPFAVVARKHAFFQPNSRSKRPLKIKFREDFIKIKKFQRDFFRISFFTTKKHRLIQFGFKFHEKKIEKKKNKEKKGENWRISCQISRNFFDLIFYFPVLSLLSSFSTLEKNKTCVGSSVVELH